MYLKRKSKKILVSPSGNLYGSENVLFDFLIQTKLKFDYIFVPKSSLFNQKLSATGFSVLTFVRVWRLYLNIFYLCFFKKIGVLYCNESGHFKYIYYLAKLFPKINFIIHVRIIEDTFRISKTSSNIKIIAISKLIKDSINFKSELVYDGFYFSKLYRWNVSNKIIYNIGIVGRITKSKGINSLLNIYNDLPTDNLIFNFFGDIDIDYLQSPLFLKLMNSSHFHFHGFVNEITNIYSSQDVILHLNKNEPLGRIFFESMDFGVPFVGFNGGGISEIAKAIDYPYLINDKELLYFLTTLSKGKFYFDNKTLNHSRDLAQKYFSVRTYVYRMEEYLK
jgi:glycosyltransferase involved in cell wall biosynthesis